MKPEETVDYHIKATWQAITKMYNEVAIPHELTMATGYVLLNIDIEKGSSSTSLGPKMGIESTSLSRILKSLEAKGWIKRERNPTDGRGMLVFLTKKGLEKRAQAREAVLHFNQTIFSTVATAELATFFKVINQINELITAKKIYQDTL
ncbi:MAG: MarR family transcriptional regulator [Schleiferiaceae bacterium]|nr:MarR family transcriptional regulator [Schleiferiaceae bacterium]